MPPRKRPAPISLRAYAARRGVSAESVSKAIRTGRLQASVTVVGGAPKIADPDLADREWEANTQPRIDQQQQQATPAPARERKLGPRRALDDDDDDGELPDDIPPYKVSRARREAEAARREAALADLAEIEVLEKREELVPAEEAKQILSDKFTVVRTKVLSVPSRAAQRLPELASKIVPVLDELIREVLEELADDVEDGDGDIDG